MKKYSGSKLTVVFLAVAGLAVSQWMCKVEKITLEEPSPTPISEIVSKLTNAQTLEDVGFAIHLLLDKTGVGSPIKGSNYSDYTLPEELIADIAETHLRTLDDLG